MRLPERLEKYFSTINEETERAFEIAKKARAKGFDPELTPEIQIAKNMAERVVGLVSVLAPQIVGSGVVERIQELEVQYGVLDWRVAFQIALEIGQQKYCVFEDEREAIEVGVRTGFAYVTNGVVSSPLEGFVNLEFGRRNDNGEKYFRINFAGPIRNAGGTAAAVSVLIADYVRKHMNYAEYDPTDDEIGRCYNELTMYHERVTNLQYFPSEEEINFLVKRVPVEVAGDPTEKVEASNYKNLPRVPTNKLRSGYCLIYSSCIPLKAPKLWKQLQKWGDEMGMEQWNFLDEFIELQHHQKAKSKSGSSDKNEEQKISPVYTYITDLVAGRPVFGHPLRPGGFRLRFGRSRLSGLSGQSIHPATSILANEFIATATQLKVERPGKATAITMCDEIEGPIVRLTNGDVEQVRTTKRAREIKNDVEKILYLGDILICYGDFLDRAHPLIPPGYCEEWWVQELEKAANDVPEELIKHPITTEVSFEQAKEYSKKYGVPLHPKYTFFYNLATVEQLRILWENIRKAPQKEPLVFENISAIKTILEMLGVPHKPVQEQYIVVVGDAAKILRYTFSLEPAEVETAEEFMQSVSPVFLRDKAGVFVGTRMGRPEKAKMRKMKGSPHCLFPVGDEGGRLRSFQAAAQEGKVTAQFELYWSKSRRKLLPTRRDPITGEICEERWWHPKTGISDTSSDDNYRANRYEVDVKEYFEFYKETMQETVFPDLIKGVRGTMHEDHSVEHLFKGFLRARHDIHVNKDGTTRYDASEVPVTHFTPKEIGITAQKASSLGYTVDIHNKPITSEDQVIELFPQDIILPACKESPDEPADEILFRVAQYVDELLVKLYGLKPYYNAKKKSDLVGHYMLALAPHTSAAMVCRIIGYSKTQGLFYHPYLHCATRRDCDGDEGAVFLMMDAFLNFSKRYLPSSRGGTMDAPLVLTTRLVPAEVDDMVFNMDIAWKYPLEFYEACVQYKMPWEVKIPIVEKVLNTPEEFYGMGFTHNTSSMNQGNHCSSYKTLPSMQEKLECQMDLAVKLMAVDEQDVARLVIEKHFIRDLKGNLRKFSQQGFRCVNCNDKYRRPPLRGNCHCGGRIIFTISEGSVVKYLTPAESLVKTYNLDLYLAQTIELTRRRVEEVFGKDPEKQLGLGEWFG